MLELYPVIASGFAGSVPVVPSSVSSFHNNIHTYAPPLGFRFPNRLHIIVVFRTCGRDCGHARTGGQETNDKVFSGKPL
jgi:hypothetical protein